MLKIKDEVDLKELEKYGFYETTFDMSFKIGHSDHTVDVNVSLNDGVIFIKNDYYDLDYEVEIPSVVYDLIKDGLVEKVEEKQDE